MAFSLPQQGDHITVESIQRIVDERVTQILIELFGALRDDQLAEMLERNLPEESLVMEAAKRLGASGD